MAGTTAEFITCPKCKRTLQVPASYYGQTVQCPECRHQFIAKAESSAVQSSPPPIQPRPEPEPSFEEPARHRDDDDDDDDRLDDMPRIRQSSIPHRGGMILAMGLLALILFPYTIICGPMAWMMGNTDMAGIRGPWIRAVKAIQAVASPGIISLRYS